MLSLFARHIVSNLPVLRTNVLPSSVLTSSAFVATRRTFFTTRRIQLPVAASKSASTTATKKTTKKTTAKKVAPKKAKAATKAKSKPKSKPKSTATSKKAAVEPLPPKRVPKSELPPTRPPNAYVLFFSKLVKGIKKGDIKNITDTQSLAKQAATTWKDFTLADKQPYYNEVEVLKKQYEEKIDNYWKTAPPQVVRKINARRKHDGKNKIHRPPQEGDYKRPKGPFLRFMGSFRQSDEGRAIKAAGVTATGRAAVNAAREAGVRWRAMSASDKAPYVEDFQKEHAVWLANHPRKSASASASS